VYVNRQYVPVEDKTIKNVFYCGHWAFSYTGLAEIEGKGTDDWLVDALPTRSKDWIEIITQKATEAFRKVNWPQVSKRHAFAAVGWLKKEATGPFLPAALLISNYHGPQGEELDEARDEFTAGGKILPQHRAFLINSVGQPVTPERRTELSRNINRCIEKGTGPTEVLRLMVETIRQTAQHNEAVGKNMLALSLPKESAGKPSMALSGDGTADDKENSFLCINEDGSDFVVHHPSLKCGGTIAHNVFDIHVYPPPRRL
jgi:hypothetical protein